ncbi:PLAC8 family-domain-containing protein [Apodospora peruviana]|uniref:PLAC8 family-domain-containing protein n=1 Tax=Apodospora peruviana TaxID=516989 RepID=A0AAE0M782_9PEZI|nr:PLAC8 family-domain-containing protein [Apodospora peruviana]
MDAQKHQTQEKVEPKEKWLTNFCICTPFSDCLMAYFAPCYMVGQTADRLRDPTMKNADMNNSDCTNFAAFHCITGCGFITVMKQREDIRKRYNIKGSSCGDCCATCWCMSCALMQNDNEVKRREAVRMAANPVVEAYQAPPGMMLVPQQEYQQHQQQQQLPQYQQQQHQ